MSQSTKPTASEPRLCKMGCGFFGSGATEDCCSKCFLEKQKKLGLCQPAVLPKREEAAPVVQPTAVVAMEETTLTVASPEPMDVELTTPVEASTATSSDLKKKKKKTSYKAMMAAMTKSDAPRDVEKEKDAIRKTTGGGAFSKIEKI